MKTYYLYIITNKNNKVLYIGMTNDLQRRMYEHKNKIFKGFSAKYNCNKLVYYSFSNDVNSIIVKEKEVKKWRREKKIRLIEDMNPGWKDLSDQYVRDLSPFRGFEMTENKQSKKKTWHFEFQHYSD
ncbi:MAG: GIY-YIG nuclease family protein [Ignavibacteriales bacterium]|nr:GIY-YIG nuclease family protein [Ignavibacteriales bacterium]